MNVQLLLKDKRVRFGSIILAILITYNFLVYSLVQVERISDQSALTTYENAYWYSMVTLTTVGYGDLYPTTLYGRMIGYVFIFSSLLFYGLLIGNFSNLVASFKESKRLGHNGTSFKNHTIIIGWNEFGRMVADQILGVEKKVAIVTNLKSDIDQIHEIYGENSNAFILYSDFKNYEMLKKAHIETSSIVFVNFDDDTEKLVYILNIKKIFPMLEFVVTLDKGELKNTFISAGVTNTISKHEIASKMLASYMFEPDVAQYFETITSYAETDSDHDIKQFIVNDKNPYCNKTYYETFLQLKEKYNAILIGISKRDKFGQRKLIKNPMGEIIVNEGDYLILLLNGKSAKFIRKVFRTEEGFFKKPANEMTNEK